MRARLGAVVIAGVAVLGVGPAAGAAATATWTVQPGGKVAANGKDATLTDTTTNSVLNCSSNSMSSTLGSGSGLPGKDIGSVTSADFRCGGPFSFPKLKAQGLPWHLNLVTYNPQTGVSRGTISHLQLALTGPGCAALVKGTSNPGADGVVAVSYASKTGRLKVLPTGGNLHWEAVSGCAGLVGTGDPATMSAGFTVTPLQTITSP